MSLSDIEFISDNETINSQSDEECNDDNEDFLAYFTKKFSVNTIIHTSVPIEYPRTSPTGVATIYNITGWSNPLACFSDYVSGEKWHRYMKIPDDIDLISLLRNLFNGSHIPEIENNEYFFHTHNGGEVVRGKLLKNHAM
uniref:Uncharacterized protein n=1 Tax=Rhizophagus irregularis (strain DAOM 181602 / DAOM 197198 / MUCL 43194) TaxID=747089 RepID=U9URR9_RHIID